MKKLLSKSAIAAGVVLSLAAVTRPAMAASFNVTIEAPGQQEATYSNLVDYHVENFDEQKQGYNSTGFAFAGDKSIGSYNSGLIENPDAFGGAGGKGEYFDVDTNRSGANQTSSTLTFTNPERYFGLWWSAGDANNVLSFYSKNSSGVEQLVQQLTTGDVVNYIKGLPNSQKYYGNPNNGQDGGEPFAFLNFYANTGVTFDQIVFSNIGGTGFESDNHTVARDYKTTTGNSVSTPESSSLVGIFVVGFVGATSVLTRRVKKKSAFGLS